MAGVGIRVDPEIRDMLRGVSLWLTGQAGRAISMGEAIGYLVSLSNLNVQNRQALANIATRKLEINTIPVSDEQ